MFSSSVFVFLASIVCFMGLEVEEDLEGCPYLNGYCTCSQAYRASCTDTNMTNLSFLKENINNDTFVLITIADNNISSILNDDFPSDLYPDLMGLNLNCNYISTVEPLAFQGLKNLQYLNLSSNNIDHIHLDTFKDNTNMIEILLSNNALSQVDFVRKIPSLRYLFLDGNKISHLPNKSFTTSPHSDLYFLNLRRNGIKTIEPKAFYGLKKLQFLFLESNFLITLNPATFRFASHLRYFHVSGNKLKDLTAFNNMMNLREAFLSNNHIHILPNDIFFLSRASNLEELNLDNNSISIIKPRAFHYLQQLWKLSLVGNNISTIPVNTFQYTTALNILDLSKNKISTLQFIRTLPQLEYLYLSHNEISTLSTSTFCTPRPSEMFKIDLSNNKISVVDENAFKCLVDLEILDLSHNRITSLHPDVFQATSELIELDLSFNMIRAIDGFQNILSLEVLVLSHNLILNLDNYTFTSKKQSHLSQLYLDNNQLCCVEYLSFDGISELDVLDVSSNKIIYIEPNTFPYVHNYHF